MSASSMPREESNSKRGVSPPHQQQTVASSNSTGGSNSSSTSSSAVKVNHEDQHEPQNKKMKQFSDLHVEAMIHPCCILPLDDLKQEIEKFVVSTGQRLFTYNEGPIDLTTSSSTLQQSCLHISLTPPLPHKSITPWNTSSIIIHPYTLIDTPPEPEEIDGGDEEPITVCETLQLPHISLHTSWENLILAKHLKRDLLNYARSALLFSKKNVSPHIINWNRVLLLYGPPGTGKTSLCKALAHKLVIRSMDIYKSGGYLLEIKSHSLFSKWFSESGKLISRLFGRIREMVEDEPDALFVVLIDEVESLAGSRVSSGGAEPSDAVRAVNSLLTSLDSIRQFRNVLVVCTSNITGCVDEAFIDRVDWMVKVDLPCLEARYEILRGCLVELERAGILNCMNGDGDSDEDGLSDGKIQNFEQVTINGKQSGAGDPNCSQKLLECATLAKGLSGRALRKLPFQSHAFHVNNCTQCDTVSAVHFLAALKSGIERKIKGDV